jgi:hypothetical protein
MIRGRVFAARARPGAAACAKAAVPRPNTPLPKRRRLSWQNPHMDATYHKTFKMCYDELKSFGFLNSGPAACRLALRSAIEARNGV